MHEQSVKITSGLCGEVYKVDDPQCSTDVQRSWLYTKDPSVIAMQNGKIDQRPKTDNGLSWPLGDGERAHVPLSDEVGFYRHKRDITIIKNQVITRK